MDIGIFNISKGTCNSRMELRLADMYEVSYEQEASPLRNLQYCGPVK